jgi:hypothetical protein
VDGLSRKIMDGLSRKIRRFWCSWMLVFVAGYLTLCDVAVDMSPRGSKKYAELPAAHIKKPRIV